MFGWHVLDELPVDLVFDQAKAGRAKNAPIIIDNAQAITPDPALLGPAPRHDDREACSEVKPSHEGARGAPTACGNGGRRL